MSHPGVPVWSFLSVFFHSGFSKFIPLVVSVLSSFSCRITCQRVIIRTLSTHSSAEGHVGCLHLLATVPSAAMTPGAQVFVWTQFSFLLDVPQTGTAGSHAVFGLWRNVFHSGRPILQPPWQCLRVLLSPHLCPHSPSVF